MSIDWRTREQERFEDGTYTEVPYLLSLGNIQYNSDHYIHLSVEEEGKDGMVAYTPSEEYGERDRQVRLKFGKYLKKHYPLMDDKKITAAVEEFIRKVTGAEDEDESEVYRIHFTRDRDMIGEIFETKLFAHGSAQASCMYGKFDNWDDKPYDVYADSPDVQVAYMTLDDEIVARSVVGERSKKWVRVYTTYAQAGRLYDQFLALLDAAGYEGQGGLLGHRLSYRGNRAGEPVLPYLDGSVQGVLYSSDSATGRKWWVVTHMDEAEYLCDSTDGDATRVERCDHCGCAVDDCVCANCSCCGLRYTDGEECPSCEEICTACARCHTHGRCRCVRCEDCGLLIEECECPAEEEESEEESAGGEVAASGFAYLTYLEGCLCGLCTAERARRMGTSSNAG